jgi:hypothetical protein
VRNALKRCPGLAVACATAFVVLLSTSSLLAVDAAPYVGAEKCKNCHSAASKGDQYGKWGKEDHAKAFAKLAEDKAMKLGKEKGVAEPQKDKACLTCHVTAFEEPAESKGKKFDPTLGVQCESCHGPGNKHVKARLDAEDAGDKLVKIPSDEIVAIPAAENCKKCHNEKSPSYKPFDYKKYLKDVAHPDPRRNYPADYLDKLGDSGGKP